MSLVRTLPFARVLGAMALVKFLEREMVFDFERERVWFFFFFFFQNLGRWICGKNFFNNVMKEE